MVAIAASSLGLGSSYLGGALGVHAPSGTKCRVFRGWPTAGALNDDLASGVAGVSIFPVPRGTRNMTRHLLKWRSGPTVTPTLTVSVSGNVVTFDGRGSAGQVAGVRFGPLALGNAHSYRLTYFDTPITVAEQLSARIPGSTFAANVLTLPSDLFVRATVVADQPAWLETRRQEQQIWVIGWCPNPAARDAVMGAVDAGFSNMLDQFGRPTNQFALPDGSNAILRYMNTSTDDAPQQASLWRRDIRYRVEYPTTLLQQQPGMIFGGGHIDGVSPFGDLLTSDPQDDQTLYAISGVMVASTLSKTQVSDALSDIAALATTQTANTLSAAASH